MAICPVLPRTPHLPLGPFLNQPIPPSNSSCSCLRRRPMGRALVRFFLSSFPFSSVPLLSTPCSIGSQMGPATGTSTRRWLWTAGRLILPSLWGRWCVGSCSTGTGSPRRCGRASRHGCYLHPSHYCYDGRRRANACAAAGQGSCGVVGFAVSGLYPLASPRRGSGVPPSIPCGANQLAGQGAGG